MYAKKPQRSLWPRNPVKNAFILTWYCKWINYTNTLVDVDVFEEAQRQKQNISHTSEKRKKPLLKGTFSEENLNICHLHEFQVKG